MCAFRTSVPLDGKAKVWRTHSGLNPITIVRDFQTKSLRLQRTDGRIRVKLLYVRDGIPLVFRKYACVFIVYLNKSRRIFHLEYNLELVSTNHTRSPVFPINHFKYSEFLENTLSILHNIQDVYDVDRNFKNSHLVHVIVKHRFKYLVLELVFFCSNFRYCFRGLNTCNKNHLFHRSPTQLIN